MYINEDFLFEATFRNPANLERHYEKHVLKPGEKFNPRDPKFPYMTIKEYAKRAEDFSNEKAGDSEDRVSHTIGWISDKKEWKFPRIVKFRKSSRLHKGFGEMVAYVDSPESGTEVIQYMLTRPGKIFREKPYMISELPENIKDETKDIDEMFVMCRDIPDYQSLFE